MKRYRKRNHELVFDEWWACKNCHATGPELNKNNCINHRHKHAEEYDDDSGHRHKIRNTDAETEYDATNNRNNCTEDGIEVNKQARKRAEDKQAE
eukprot:2637038-Heterocapsa_arctica.AAC.1